MRLNKEDVKAILLLLDTAQIRVSDIQVVMLIKEKLIKLIDKCPIDLDERTEDIEEEPPAAC